MVPAAAGTPQYSGNFIPEVWSLNLLVKYYGESVFPGIANTKYEGEIKNKGDVVNIRTRATIIIGDYEKNADMDTQHPDSPMIEFPIRKAKYFNFICDDIDAHQSDINLMNEWSQDAAEQMKAHIDALGLGDVYAYAHAKNMGATAGYKTSGYNLGSSGSSVAITKANVIDFLMTMMAALDEQDATYTGRWWVIPNWMNLYLKLSDLKDVSMTGDSASPIRNGRVGGLDGNTIHKSNQIKQVTDTYLCHYIMAGNMDAITFASNMTQMDNVKDPKKFGQIVRGLNVFDYKVIKPEGLVTGYVRKG